ncbi:PIN domain-containing protein [Candidatus Coxiella mudrowiae]|uniref:PIN domain-containing protein n=1 Tax=Candidatus Coxiella mudrowiae TaxID=2054173 RepID=A0ABM5UU34_9COXI|nr:hypothetical protein [Candidatus Coxiella mudrowiae]AKQ33454.1 hypothetical protein CleRT_05510 [Candidatus Coxiella mudrowiae]AKQ33541.1 hypothetical protein CleRT_06950 [Candidatus Coxiella mudrowiae]
MKVVVDINVLISGMGGLASAPQNIIDARIEDKFTVVATPKIVEDIRRMSDIFSKKYAHLEFEHIVNKLLFAVKLFEPEKLMEGISCDLGDG